jgi:hypothetical protein
MTTFTLIAHRGCSARAPENTFAAFELAVREGYSSVETDVQLSADGACFVLHDESLGRVNDGHGLVSQWSADYLRTLDAGSWFDASFKGERIPLLEELLQRYRGRLHLHLVRPAAPPAAPQSTGPPPALNVLNRLAAWSPQELKSTQAALPAAVAWLVESTGWSALAGPARAHQLPAPAEEQSFQAPGLTITSFHLQQLTAMRKVGAAAPCRALAAGCRSRHLARCSQRWCPRGGRARGGPLVLGSWSADADRLMTSRRRWHALDIEPRLTLWSAPRRVCCSCCPAPGWAGWCTSWTARVSRR